MIAGATENDRRIVRLDGRRMGRESADCMLEIGDWRCECVGGLSRSVDGVWECPPRDGCIY
jgi:hypothetical protein